MSCYDELIKSEIQLADDECCILFDFGCYFPYSNFDVLTFEFNLGTEEFADYKINHRYPNKNWHTISKKYGRKLSKLGYPYIMKLNEQEPMTLCLRVGIKEKYMTLLFPIQTSMTKDKPICGLSLEYKFEESRFCFTSYEKEKEDDLGWRPHRWWSSKVDGIELSEFDTLLSPPRIGTLRLSDFDLGTDYIYIANYIEDVIEPCPSTLLDLLVTGRFSIA